MTDATTRLPGLDGIRAVAVLLVIFHHLCSNGTFADWPAVAHALKQGIFGVQIFFVLSGFVLSHSLLQAGPDAATPAFLARELAAPRTLEQIVADARPALAADVYAAALIAISADTEAERAYLDRLALGLSLSPEARARIHQQLGQPL